MNRHLAPLITAAMLVASPLSAFDLTSMSDAERTAFGAEIRAYLLENPEVIMEAVSVLEKRTDAAQEQNDGDLIATNAEAIFDDGDSWVGGNPDGDITVVEFVDYRCGYCRKAHDEVAQLIKSDGNIRFIVKEFPILGADSLASARFAIATRRVAGDAAYKAAHDALISLKTEASETALSRVAEGLNLDADAILKDMNSDEVSAIIGATHALAGRLQISGTPTFVMGDQMVRGYVPFDGMQQIVAELRKK